MKNRAKTPALARTILESALYYESENRDLQYHVLHYFRDALLDYLNPAFIDRNTPEFISGLSHLNTLIAAMQAEDLHRDAIIDQVLSIECKEEEGWTDLFLDAANRMEYSRHGLEKSEYDFLLWILEFIGDNRQKRGDW